MHWRISRKRLAAAVTLCFLMSVLFPSMSRAQQSEISPEAKIGILVTRTVDEAKEVWTEL
jgi:hypothetical protein